MTGDDADVIVIGGGISGLAAAVALLDTGLRVIVIERDAHLGGRARSWIDDETGDAVDIGPHVLHSEYHNMLAFLQRLGTRDLITWQPGKVLTLASAPRPLALKHWPLPPPFSLFPSMITAPGISTLDGLSMAGAMWHGMRFGEEDVEALDGISALDFLRDAGVSERMIAWWWAFASMVVANIPLERCSAAYLMRVHAQLSGHRHLHFGFASVGLSDLYVPQVADLIERSRGRVITGAEVRGFIGQEKVDGIVLADGTRLKARHCISAVPPAELLRLLPDRWKAASPFRAFSQFEPSPYISCYLWFDRKITSERFVSHLWSPTRLNYDFYDLSAIRRGWRHRASVMASNIIYSHRAGNMSDAEIIRATLSELAEFAPDVANARLMHARVHRIPMAIPCPTPGNERRRPAARTAIDGLTLAGDWVQTHLPFSMESAVCAGWLAAEEILADLGRSHRIAKAQRPYDGLAGLVRGARVRRQRGVSHLPGLT